MKYAQENDALARQERTSSRSRPISLTSHDPDAVRARLVADDGIYSPGGEAGQHVRNVNPLANRLNFLHQRLSNCGSTTEIISHAFPSCN